MHRQKSPLHEDINILESIYNEFTIVNIHFHSDEVEEYIILFRVGSDHEYQSTEAIRGDLHP